MKTIVPVAKSGIDSKFRMPQGFWSNNKNHQVFLEWASHKLKIKNQEDWYQVEARSIDDLGGNHFLHHYYNSSLALALEKLYPDKQWLPWKFVGGVPNGYWKDLSNQRRFFDWLKTQLNIQTTEQWYSVKVADVAAHGGGHLLKTQYHSSLGLALQAIYPELDLHPWRFQGGVPKGYWNYESNIQKFVKYMMDYYDLKLDDLKWITTKNIKDIGGGSLIQKIGGLENFVQKYFPAFESNTKTSKGQYRLFQAVKMLFPKYDVVLNYRLPVVRYHSCELDVFIPQLNLGLEYQGQYHYQWNYLHGAPEEQQKRDQAKKEMCKSSNITLIEIPFWWDMKTSSLAATIAKYRPDVALGVDPTAKPIPQEVPQSVIETSHKLHSQRLLQQVDSDKEAFQRFPYVLSVTSYRSKCYTCKTPLKKGDLKIQAEGIFKANDSSSYRAKYSLCFNKKCLENIPLNNPKVTFAPFQNTIAIPQKTKELMESLKTQDQLQQLEGIQWAYL